MTSNSEKIDRVRTCVGSEVDVADIDLLPTLPHSVVARLTLEDGSTRIFKCATDARHEEGLRRESAVDDFMLSRFAERVSPRLIDQGERNGALWLLFEDLSSSHFRVDGTKPLSPAHVGRFATLLARVHVQSAERDLPEAASRIPGFHPVTRGTAAAAELLEQFFEDPRRRLLPEGSTNLVRTLQAHLSELVSRIEPLCVNMIHGDAHLGNAMFSPGEAVFVDWATAAIGPGELDAAHAIALNMPRASARSIERQLVSSYATACARLGARTDPEASWWRYRLCLNMTVLVAIAMAAVPGLSDEIVARLQRNAFSAALEHRSVEVLHANY